jgi:hypothetical protein
MKFIIAVLLTVLLGFALPLYLPWWSFAITSFLVAVIIKQLPGKSFLAGFIAIALLWGIQAATLDANNGHLLSHKVALLLPFNGSGAALLFTTMIIGGLVSGMAALTGSYVVIKKIEHG